MAGKATRKKLIKLCEMLLENWGQEIYVFDSVTEHEENVFCGIILVVEKEIADGFFSYSIDSRSRTIRLSNATNVMNAWRKSYRFIHDIDDVMGAGFTSKLLDIYLAPPFWQQNEDFFNHKFIKGVLLYDPYSRKFKRKHFAIG